jgi:hypothetical protein
VPTRSYSERVVDLALELSWSLWAELGVSGWKRNHDAVAIDLEPLVIASSVLGRLDARLLGESLDWSVANPRFVSAVRLRNLLPTFDRSTTKAFGNFAATVRKHRTASWPGEGRALRWSPTGRSSVPILTRPALVQLRLRAIFGVSARAEIIKWMLPQPNRPFGIAELAMFTSYGKDNLADALDMMTLAGVVTRNVMTTAGNAQVFTLSAASRIEELLGEIPSPNDYPYWAARFRVVLELVDFAHSAPEDPTVRAAEIQRRVGQMQSDLRWLGTFPYLRRGIEAVNNDFEKWSIAVLSNWARIPQNSVQDPGNPVDSPRAG